MPQISPPSPPTETRSLRQRTTHGVMWVGAQAAVTRAVTFVQQLTLAWLLAKSDFGLIGLTYTVTSFITLMANPGVDTVLIQRARQYRHWATPAFWFGMTASIVATIITIVFAAPLAAWAYEQPQVIGLIAVLATALPIQALQIVPRAQLQIQMRFRAVVLLGLLGSVLTAGLSIAAAYLGMGAYSFVVPVPIVSVVVGAATWWLARPPIRLNPAFARWKYLFGNSFLVGASKVLYLFINQADYIALGLAGLSDASIGAYVLAFNVAIQPLRLISGNVPVVLFPGLSQLSLEPERQVRAMLRAMRLLMLVTVPVCLLQIVLAEPMFRLVFPPRWMDAVLPCQILTIGLMINATSWPTFSLYMAQGRFREQLWVTAGGTVLFVAILAFVILVQPSIVSVAVGVALFHCIYSPSFHWFATRHHAPRGSFVRETGPPLLAGLVAAAPCIILHKNLPATVGGNLAAIAGGGLLFTAVYLLLIYLLVPASIHDLLQQVAPLWQRLRRTTGESATDKSPGDGMTT